MIPCPSCAGTGRAPSLNLPCLWCRATGAVAPARALVWADQTEMLACAGFVAGDHDAADMREMLAEAVRVRATIAARRT